jgi:hypothetical protein
VTPGAVHEVKRLDHESACHLRRGKKQTAANGVAAKIQTETIKKLESNGRLGSISEVGARNREVCFAPMSRHRQLGHACPKSAISGSDKPYVAMWEHETGQP